MKKGGMSHKMHAGKKSKSRTGTRKRRGGMSHKMHGGMSHKMHAGKKRKSTKRKSFLQRLGL